MVLLVANCIFTQCGGGFAGVNRVFQVVEGGFVGCELHFYNEERAKKEVVLPKKHDFRSVLVILNCLKIQLLNTK